MIFITGPLYSGKKAFARQILHCGENALSKFAAWDVQNVAADCPDLSKLAEKLASDYKVVIATEIGGGVVPIDAAERARREAAGQLACLLAARADIVVRVFCGIPQVLKGKIEE